MIILLSLLNIMIVLILFSRQSDYKLCRDFSRKKVLLKKLYYYFKTKDKAKNLNMSTMDYQTNTVYNCIYMFAAPPGAIWGFPVPITSLIPL